MTRRPAPARQVHYSEWGELGVQVFRMSLDDVLVDFPLVIDPRAKVWVATIWPDAGEVGSELPHVVADLFEPRYEWRPWHPDYRLPLELGARRFLLETCRRLAFIVFVLLFVAALPVHIIIGLIILIVLLIGMLLSGPEEDPRREEPRPAVGMQHISEVDPPEDLDAPITISSEEPAKPDSGLS